MYRSPYPNSGDVSDFIYNSDITDFVQVDDNASVDVPADSIPSQDETMSDIKKLIVNSALYKQAYKIFSSDTRYGNPFLQQLIAIPESVRLTDKNFWDEASEFFGSTSRYEELLTDAYNTAMDEIRSLITDYYSFKNSLPVEQEQQLREAGYNSSVTGQGLTDGSSMPDSSATGVIQPNAPSSQYSNEQLSNGVVSFVEFIGSMASLVTTGVDSKSVLGLLDLAEREGYSKQEVHDLLMANQGVTTSSPYRVLTPANTEVIEDVSTVAKSKPKAQASALTGEVAVSVGNDPDKVQSFEIMTGQDVLNRVSQMQLVENFGRGYIASIQAQNEQIFADLVSRLDQEQRVANLEAGIAEGDFNYDYFSNRNGITEGSNQTSISEALTSIRQSEAMIQEFNSWIADYKYQQLSKWGEEIKSKPYLAPYFYKAMFDFNMTDTFYHQSPLTQGIKYGLEIGNGVTNFISSLIPVPMPKKLTRSVSTGPRGTTETITETITQ